MSAKEKEVLGEEKTAKRGLMFVLEDVALFDLHEVMFSALKKMLKERDVDLTPPVFSSHFILGTISRNVPHFLRVVGRERLSDTKLAGEINEAIVSAFVAEKPNTAVKSLVEKARAKGLAVGAISLLGDEHAEALIAKTGLEELLDGVLCCGNDGLRLPGSAEPWRRLAKTMGVKPLCTLGVSSTSTSMRGTLRSGARACVLETTYSSCQDFGGANAVVSSLKDLQSAVDAWVDISG